MKILHADVGICPLCDYIAFFMTIEGLVEDKDCVMHLCLTGCKRDCDNGEILRFIFKLTGINFVSQLAEGNIDMHKILSRCNVGVVNDDDIANKKVH